MLTLSLPPEHAAEQAHIAAYLLGERLGVPFRPGPPSPDVVRLADGEGRSLTFGLDLFARPSAAWLKPACLPREPVAWWEPPPELAAGLAADLADRRLPVLYGQGGWRLDNGHGHLGLDVLGTAFYFLSRLEEVAAPALDAHGRFPATAGLAWRLGVLDRPLVDELVEVARAALTRLWPGLPSRRSSFRQILSHDVDQLFRYDRPWRRAAGHLLKRRDPAAAWAEGAGWVRTRLGGAADPWDRFERLMDISEAEGLASAFYFITDWSDPTYDRGYRFAGPSAQALLRRVHARGHEIGLHASYGTLGDGRRLAREFARLRHAAARNGIRQARWGGRQHYLRWRAPDSFQDWRDAGLDYDSTLGFADAAGFRCGTCHEFPAFNLATATALSLRERPLIAMDCSVIDQRYQGLGAGEAALDRLLTLKARCRHYGGAFTLLWHNSRLADDAEEALYRAAVAG